MQSSPHRGVVHFGPFEVDLQQGVVRKRGVKIRLQTQPFQVLAALLEEPGAVVTREELRRHLWPQDTFVDFEHRLNVAVGKLRQALGDSAEEPRYIETLAKRGYRFAGEVQGQAHGIEDEAPSNSVPVAAAKHGPVLSWIAVSVLLAAAGGVTYRFVSNPSLPLAPHPAPLTSFRGMEVNPALSPDGNQVAFAWNGEKQDNFDIYVMPVRSGAPVPLTTDTASDVSPAWSPDGCTIAFIRQLGDTGRGELRLVPADGGPEHKVREIWNEQLHLSLTWRLSLSWSPDGQWIAVAHRGPEDLSDAIYLVSRTGETRRLTSTSGDPGDGMPRFSPDGRSLAFSRLTSLSSSEIYVLPLDRRFQPAGEARRLTAHKRWSVNPAWTENGSGLFYVFGQRPVDDSELRAIDISDPQRPARTIQLGDQVREITVGRHLVYSRQIDDLDIWRVRLPGAGMGPATPERFISSTRRDLKPSYSTDGKKIAYVSSRSGFTEIWVAKADGSKSIRLTSFGGPMIGNLDWSPDDQWIVFHSRPEGQADVFAIPAAGGSPKRLTGSNSDDTLPIYSHDGRWIYFGSLRSGTEQIWRMPAEGGEATPITTRGGVHPLESVDSETIYYIKPNANEIWSVPAQGGQEVKVAGPLHAFPSGFAVTAKGLYYTAPPHSGELRFIRFHSFATGKSTPVATVNRPVDLGMSVSPDSKYLLFDQIDESSSDLMIVENFRPQ